MPVNSPEKLIICDTSLRDSEQSLGDSMTKDEKILIAKPLERMKVDAVFPGKKGYIQPH